MADPFFSSVVLLCHFDGTHGSTVITDSSSMPHSLTASGSSLTTAQQKFGTASLDGTSIASYASTPDSADWHFGSGQFTIEAWVRPTVSVAAGFQTICSQFGGASDLGWWLGWNTGVLSFYYAITGTDIPFVGAAYSPTLNAWMHVAVDRDASNVVRVYANGVVIASATVASTFYNSTRELTILNDSLHGRGLIGQIDELRITKGVARYAGAFTPPTAPFDDTAALTAINLAGDTREVLFAPIPTLAVGGGMVREVLLAAATAILFDGVAREVLLVDNPIVSAQQTAVSVIT